MVQVKQPPVVTPSAPSREPRATWLTVVATIFLADSLVPWERWCGGVRLPERCFAARVWSGSASLLGVLALVVVFVVATFRASAPSVPGPWRLAAFAGFLTAAAAKSVVVIDYAATGQDPGPTWLGVWIGIGATGLGWVVLLRVIARHTPRRRHIGAVAAVSLLIVALTIPYARSGLAWWGGPLSDPESLGGGNGVGMRVTPGRPDLFTGLLVMRNLGSVSVTLDGLDLVEPTSPIHVLETYVIDFREPCPAEAVELPDWHRRDGCGYPLHGYRLEPGGEGDSVRLAALLEVRKIGLYRSGWFRIRYHAGVLPFEMFRTDLLVLCAPEPGKKRCPGDGF